MKLEKCPFSAYVRLLYLIRKQKSCENCPEEKVSMSTKCLPSIKNGLFHKGPKNDTYTSEGCVAVNILDVTSG